MLYYGRSKEGCPEREWQPLREHLVCVSERSAQFATTFGWGEFGRIAGLLHDLGKYSHEFQLLLRTGSGKVEHSTTGSQVALQYYGPVIGRLLAHAVQGHHGSLPDFGSEHSKGSLVERLQRKLPDCSAYLQEIALPAKPSLPWRAPDHIGLAYSLLIRMLFSCVVDADRLDAERYCNLEKSMRRGISPNLSDLARRLQDYLDDFVANVSDTLVNRERAHVLRCCRDASSSPPGIFTLTVPTGGGKTLSSLDFAVRHALHHGLRRVIYVIPFTSIIEQTASKFRGIFGDDAVLEHHSNYDFRDDDVGITLSLATENWDMPIVVTTNVQFFESLYASRAGLCRKLHNISESVIILDEAQSIPDDYLLPCLAVLEELVRHYRVSAVVCTATQPALQGLWPLATKTHEIIPDAERLYTSLRRVKVEYVGDRADSQIVSSMRQQRQALCIVNTRRHAATLYRLLQNEIGHYHLSARMYPAHREKKLAEIRERLTAGATCRVISTQIMEAGIDVDFPVVWRSVAGIDAIAQAAGRCNREGKLDLGETYVFEPEGALPRGWFTRMAVLGRNVLRELPDPLSPIAVKRFFSERFMLDGAGLDKRGILRALQEREKTLSFQFREVSDQFKLIDDLSHPIVIPCAENQRLIEEVESAEFPGMYSRRLQRYTVAVSPHDFALYRQHGWLRQVREMYYLLDYPDGYSDELGLLLVDDALRSSLIK